MIISEGPQGGEDHPVTDTLTAASIAQDDDAITLGDIPLLADQTIRHHPRPEGRPVLATLNMLQSLIIKHFALLQLQKTSIGHVIELDEVLELLESRKNQWWNKIFKGNQKKDQKKKGPYRLDGLGLGNMLMSGVFGVPIEILVERTGSDSQRGATNQLLRVPEFIEDIVSTMRQMGEYKECGVERLSYQTWLSKEFSVKTEISGDSSRFPMRWTRTLQRSTCLKKTRFSLLRC